MSFPAHRSRAGIEPQGVNVVRGGCGSLERRTAILVPVVLHQMSLTEKLWTQKWIHDKCE